MGAPNSVRRACRTWTAVAAALCVGLAGRGADADPPRPPHEDLTPDFIGTQVPTIPPPLLAKLESAIARFWELYYAYQAISQGDHRSPRITFAQWLLINGVTDPLVFDIMMRLYHSTDYSGQSLGG